MQKHDQPALPGSHVVQPYAVYVRVFALHERISPGA
jgi:hypothetical protein